MSKAKTIVRRIFKTIIWVVAVFVLLFVIIAGLIQIPAVQNRIIHKVTAYVSNKTHTRVEINNISISFPESVVIKGLFLEDLQKDTLIYAGKVKINIAMKELLSSKININYFTLEDVNLNLKRSATDSLFNYNFLLTTFGSSAPSENAPPPTRSKWTFNIGKVSLSNIRLHWNDAYGGMNVVAVLGYMVLKIEAFDPDKSVYSIDKLMIDRLFAGVKMTKPTVVSADKSAGVLPKILANSFVISHSSIAYSDGLSNLSVKTRINAFELIEGSVDLQKELVDLGQVRLSDSEINCFAPAAATTIPAPASTESYWKVRVKIINLHDNTLAYRDRNQTVRVNEFDPHQLKYKHVNLVAKDLSYSSAKTAVVIRSFSAVDPNNYAISQFETEFSMDQHSITAKKMKAKAYHSSVDGDLYLHFNSLAALKDSLPKLFLNADLRSVKIQNSDVLYFNPALSKQPFFKNWSNSTFISGNVTGRVNNLKGQHVVIRAGANTLVTTDFTIIGLPEVKTAFYNFPNLKINSGRQDLKMMMGPTALDSIELPETFNLLVDFKGKMKAFESTVGMKSSFGDALVYANIDQLENFNTRATLTGFNVGKVLKDTAMYGPVTMSAVANGHGLDKNTINAKLKAEVAQMDLYKYNYHNITVDGLVNRQEFDGKVNLNDPNVVVDFDGVVGFNPDRERYKFRLNVEGADLQKLNLSKEEVRIGMVTVADLKGDTKNKLNGKAVVSNVVVVKGGNKYQLDSLLYVSVNESGKIDLKKRNALISVKYTGTVSPGDLSAGLNTFINSYFPFSAPVSIPKKVQPSNFNFEILLRNNSIISKALVPELTDFEPGTIKGSFDSQKKELKLKLFMPKVVYGTIEINDIAADVSSTPAALNYKLSSSNISNAQAKLDNFVLDGKLENNTLFTNLSSIEDNLSKKIMINSRITMDHNNYRLTIDPKELFLMHNRWNIVDDNYIEFGKAGFLIHHFFISKAGSQINVASVHDKFNDDLNIEIRNFKLDDISRIIEKDTSLVKGTVDGNVLLKRVNNAYGIIADAKISNLMVRDVPVGSLTLKADNPTAEKFNIALNLSGAGNNLTSSGFFIPNGGANSVNIKTDIQSLSMKTVEAFSRSQLKESSGNLTGKIQVQGNTNAPDITGELAFTNVFIKPVVLNNRLELKNETIQFKNDGLYFKSFTLLDQDKHSAIIDGTVKMKQFTSYIYDLRVSSKDFLLFNSTVKDNKEFFGRMVIDSRIDVKGPMSLPVITGNLKMKKGSNFTFVVPEDKLSSDKGEGVVEFQDPILPNSILAGSGKKVVQKSSFSGFDISTIVEIDKQATLRLLMDPASTDSLVVRGEAALSCTMDRSGKMSLTGSYHLDDGSYLVSLESVIKRKFDINPGSTIIWNGDPLDAVISIDATYMVQATPYDLVAVQMSDKTDVEKGGYKQRYPFLVLLKLRGEILHPVISFEIQLKPEDKGILNGAVNQKLTMLNEDESALNKQVFALLVLGRFVQENPFTTESGGTSTLVRSTVGNFLSAQLNKLSSKYVPGVELNFDVKSYDDYQTGTAQGRTQVAIGVKKQLFKERLSVQVGGNVDVEGEKAKQNSASSITGDVTAEYKLTTDGRYRLKGFRQNLYEGALEGQLVETGFGVVYVRDFNKWKEFFKAPLKKSKELKIKKNNETTTTK